ncbi:MAG: HigA family addiction module antidote protein [Desulfarculaceae bacterium]|nr:HigA family addiction module antidote protein [Desulfarculaceae bacterium]MCF8098537.1 HigA family addiction module antidote protein [Desulfarculaceae bacterium]MCF8123949.1 HigA family addiction module antidote protein [Desulfarculaceae bacterium]
MRKPSHPGGILRRQYMEPLGISNTKLADAIDVTRKTVSKLVNEHSGVSPEMAMRLSLAFGTTPDFWLNLQKNYDLWLTQSSRSDWDRIERLYSDQRLVAGAVS